jgi:hypothetical protein
VRELRTWKSLKKRVLESSAPEFGCQEAGVWSKR